MGKYLIDYIIVLLTNRLHIVNKIYDFIVIFLKINLKKGLRKFIIKKVTETNNKKLNILQENSFQTISSVSLNSC